MDLSNGLILMLLGMGGVFAILTIMFFFMKLTIFLDAKIRPKKPALLPAKENLMKKAAVIAVLHHHNRKNRG